MTDPPRPLGDLPDDPKLRALRRMAYEELSLAIELAGGELPPKWLQDGDRDLQALRDLREPEWQLLVRRVSGAQTPDDPRLPEPAWGNPHRRRNEWGAVAIVSALLALAVVIVSVPLEVLAAAAAVIVIITLVQASGSGRLLVVGGLLVAAAAIAGIVFLPPWTFVALALVAITGASLLAARFVEDEASTADEQSIALRRRLEQERRGAGTKSPTPRAPDSRP